MKLKVVLFILTIISNFVSKLLNDKDTNLSENAVKSLSIISALLSSVVETPSTLDTAASLASVDALSRHADKQLNMIYNA